MGSFLTDWISTLPFIIETQQSTSSLGIEVPIGRVDRELQALFASDGDQDTGIARASLINLAIYDETAGSLESAAGIVGEIVKEAACRSILISAESQGDVSAKAWVQAHCNFVGKDQRKSVCTEQLAFKLTGATPGLVRNTIFSHLDSDLPLIFWWRGEFSEVFTDQLYSRIDRLVFDSDCWAEPRSHLLRLKQAKEKGSAQFVPHDLSFTRLNPIRSAIAKCFDNPVARKEADKITRIEITHGKDHRMAALYLAAWVASRLRCKLEKKESRPALFRYSRHSSGNYVDLSVALKSQEDGPQSIRAITMQSPNATFALTRTGKEQFWELKSTVEGCPETVELVPMREGTDAVLITEILMRGGRNHVFNDTLGVVREMLVV